DGLDLRDARDVGEDAGLRGEHRGDELLANGVLRAADADDAAQRASALDQVSLLVAHARVANVSCLRDRLLASRLSPSSFDFNSRTFISHRATPPKCFQLHASTRERASGQPPKLSPDPPGRNHAQ